MVRGSDDLYDFEEDDSRNYEEFGTEDTSDKLRGRIKKGTCLYCGAKNGMIYDGGSCFICNKCQNSVSEDIYYEWASGQNIEFED